MAPRVFLYLMLLGLHVNCVISLDNGLGLTGPAMGWSSWNHFRVAVNSSLIRDIADVMVSSGLAGVGYRYINIDDGWAIGRHANGSIIVDEQKFPGGFKPLTDYIHSKGLLAGVYSARGNLTCQKRPGSLGHEEIDAQLYADWGFDYVKYDSCSGSDDPNIAWEQCATMSKALNKTGRQIWYSITQRMNFNDVTYGHGQLHCVRPPRAWGAFTVLPWLRQGKQVSQIANSWLVEYCNNEDDFGHTNAVDGPNSTSTVQPSGFLSQLDSQQLLTFDNLTVPGGYNDNDMLECCNGKQSKAEYRSQFSTFAIQTSPLILGNDLRSMNQDCLDVIANSEVVAINQDRLVSRAKLVWQWPLREWPNRTKFTPSAAGSQAQVKPSSNPLFLNISMQLWAKPLHDNSVAIVAFNRGATPLSMNITWDLVGFPADKSARIRDLWAKSDKGLHTGWFQCEDIPSHDVCMLRISPQSE